MAHVKARSWPRLFDILNAGAVGDIASQFLLRLIVPQMLETGEQVAEKGKRSWMLKAVAGVSIAVSTIVD